MEKIKLEKYNNVEYINYLKNKYSNGEWQKELKNLDNYIDFLSSIKPHIKDFKTKSKELFSSLEDDCYLMPADDYFYYLLDLIKSDKLTLDDIAYLINSAYLAEGFKTYLKSFIANKPKPRIHNDLRKFSELDPIILELINKYNLNKEKSI